MNVIISGRETEAWLAALHSKRFNPDANVTVVYDDKTPLISSGESTTANFTHFMEDVLDIKIGDLVKNCEATIKYSTKFTNWKGDNTYYHHAFTTPHLNMMKDYFNAATFKVNVDRVDKGAMLARTNKVAIPIKESDKDIYEYVNNALHFNTKKMAEYLQKVGVSRGIKVVIGKIEDVLLDNDGYVTEIILDTNQKLKTDFVFDCTDSSRFFVNKIYKSPINSYEKMLPVKKIIHFFINKTGITPPFTEAIAMKYGWMWKIPIGKKYSCGYAFDSDLVSDEEAYDEICEITKQKPTMIRENTFKSEYNTKPFNKNTLALGLAHGFLEPLESTSLMTTVHMLNTIQNTLPSTIFDRTNRESYTEDFNKHILSYIENCVNMVYIHYLTPRNDTNFWINVKKTIPEQVRPVLQLVEEYNLANPNILDPDPEFYGARSYYPFNIYNILKCMAGVDNLQHAMMKRNQCFPCLQEMGNTIERHEIMCEKSKDHDEYIKLFKK